MRRADFPPLTGRVVDQAGILSPGRAALERKLTELEDKSGIQLVVATSARWRRRRSSPTPTGSSAPGSSGEKAKNNGVLLLVAPNEQRVRIEVGYGLEGTLTDALTKIIIATAMAPKFKQNDFPGGLQAGVDAILSVLTGDAEEWQRRAKVRSDESAAIDPFLVLVILIVLAFVLARLMRGRGGPRTYHRTRSGGWIAAPAPSDGGWGGGWSGGGGGDSGGGFSGGGGSSGGGGASGDW